MIEFKKNNYIPFNVKNEEQRAVDINNVFNGYFKLRSNIDAFIQVGLKPVLAALPKSIMYADFGGGTGRLTSAVSEYLETQNKKVQGINIDGNKIFLKEAAQERGLRTLQADLADINLQEYLPSCDLIIMRAVNHYNSLERQKLILENIKQLLKPNGILINQMSSGNLDNVILRTDIANSELLSRTDQFNQMYFLTHKTYLSLCDEVGLDTQWIGDAPSHSWSLEEMFDRFHKNDMEKLQGKQKMLLYEQRRKFIEGFNEIIESKHIDGVKREGNNTIVEYQYPIFLSIKTASFRRGQN